MKKILLFLGLASAVFAYSDANFESEIKTHIAKIESIFASNSKDKSEELFSLLAPHLDEELMANLVISSKNYKALKDEKKEEFKKLFLARVQKDFNSKIELVAGSKIELVKAKVEDKKCLVESKVMIDEQEKMLNFKFRHIENECKIYDIEILNTSLIASYKAQFMDIIKQNGINALFEKLK